MIASSDQAEPAYNIHWRRNLAVCLAGSFTTLVAMTLLLPFLPLYVEELGAEGHAAIVQWSGVAYGATFFAAALVAPLWGRLGDRYGRKLMLVRASLGMAVCMSLMGMVQSVWQLVALRLLVGLAGGYSSGSTILVAMQTPKERSGWALGTLSAGIMAGNLVGPLIGGALPPLIGIRATFLLAGGVIFLAFLATTLLVKEEARPATPAAPSAKAKSGWSQIPDKRPVAAMLATVPGVIDIDNGLPPPGLVAVAIGGVPLAQIARVEAVEAGLVAVLPVLRIILRPGAFPSVGVGLPPLLAPHLVDVLGEVHPRGIRLALIVPAELAQGGARRAERQAEGREQRDSRCHVCPFLIGDADEPFSEVLDSLAEVVDGVPFGRELSPASQPLAIVLLGEVVLDQAVAALQPARQDGLADRVGDVVGEDAAFAALQLTAQGGLAHRDSLLLTIVRR